MSEHGFRAEPEAKLHISDCTIYPARAAFRAEPGVNLYFSNDWVDDDSLSEQETLQRLMALQPVPTTGPQHDL